jgi:hypothetical protein
VIAWLLRVGPASTALRRVGKVERGPGRHSGLALIWHSANCPAVFSGVPVVSWWLSILSRKPLKERTLGDIEGQRRTTADTELKSTA